MKVLLVNNNTCDSPYPVYPLGLSYVAAAIAEGGHDVKFADLQAPGARIDELVHDFAPECIGLSIRNIDDCHIENTRFLALGDCELAHRIKSLTSVPLVLGGAGYSIYPASLLTATGADYGVKGAGERPFLALLDALGRGTDPREIDGVVFRDGNSIRVNACAGTEPPDLVPWRPERLVDYYLRESAMLNIQTQRGCGFTCCYCSYPLIEGTAFRRRDPEEIVHECELIKALGARYFFIVDSVFNTSASHVAGVCEELIRRDLGMNWGCFLRPKGLTQDLVDLMARAGLKHVEFGTDSFSDPVLDAYGKGFGFEDVVTSSDVVRKAKIRHAHFLIVGGPGETEETVQQSFENSRRLQKTVMFPFVGMRLYPHTPLWRRAVAEGVVREADELFEPFFYVSPGISKERIFAMLRKFSQEARNWVIGEPPPEVLKIMNQLRSKGVAGPMWEFLVR